MPSRLQGKVALITGCGSSGPGWGNGKAISVLCAREGAQLFGGDINFDAAKETRDFVHGENGVMEVAVCDVAQSDDVERLVESCIERFGRIDILVNNVGIVEMGGPVELPLENWNRSLAVNTTSMFLTCKHTIPHMEREGGGSIINIGSIAGVRYLGVPYIAYYTSKAAVLGFSRGVALQYAKKNIRSNVILPGLMNTPMIVEPLKGFYGGGSVDEMIRIRDSQCPTGEMGDAWDVARAAVWLASDESSYVNAGEITIDGGMIARCA